MIIAYIAGPYRGTSRVKLINWIQRQINISRAANIAKWAWRQGYAVICPHLNSKNFDGIAPDVTFLTGDIAILKRCDLMILVPGWEQSAGTLNEIKEAVNLPQYEAIWHKNQYQLRRKRS
jgi:hypothetical protein